MTDLKNRFIEIYGGSPDDIRVFSSAGRVNLIGEHTDYNGGFVFPAAISFCSTIFVRKTDDGKIKLAATDLPDRVVLDIDRLNDYRDLKWGNYQAGVAYVLQQAGYDICSCEILYHDTVPFGAGLSSSAAIEVVMALTLATFSNEKRGITEPVSMIEMAKLSQKAENVYCGVSWGIMDQFASAVGPKDHAMFEAEKERILNPVCRRRAEHVIYECDRVLKSVEALMNGDLLKFGNLMTASHISLRDLYEVTGTHLDTMVEEALKIEGCIGARMTGAGFGGSTVAIVKEDAVDHYIEEVGKNYEEKTGLKPSFYISDAADGGHEIKE